MPALPKTRSGKIMRRVVRAAWLGLDPGDLSALDDPTTIEAIRRAGPAGRRGRLASGRATEPDRPMSVAIDKDIVSWDDLADMVGRPRRAVRRPTST